jgi:hypothetical protein
MLLGRADNRSIEAEQLSMKWSEIRYALHQATFRIFPNSNAGAM